MRQLGRLAVTSLNTHKEDDMDSKLIEAIAKGKVVASIGKYVKDGIDLDYTLEVPKHDAYTGEELVETEHHSVSLAWIDLQIARTQAALDNLVSMKEILADKNVPVISDYTEKPTPPPVIEPLER
jgi:hypothetical protein